MNHKKLFFMLCLHTYQVFAQDISTTQPRPALERAELRELISEIKRFRLDLLRVLVDTRDQNIQQLERELRSTAHTRESVQEQEKEHNLEVAELNERLMQVSDSQERAEIEKARANLISSGPRRIEASEQAYAARQAELNGLLHYARQARIHFASVAAALERELSSKP